MQNIWKSGIMGVVVGDALGCPVQFESREEVAKHPVAGMRGYGTFSLPEGSWTDDSSLTIALLESIVRKKEIDLDDVMNNFMKWLFEGEFTPYGQAYDIGGGTMKAIHKYKEERDAFSCGGADEYSNGNGSLMRILPACLYCYKEGDCDKGHYKYATGIIHNISRLTHAHPKSMIACGLYYFLVKAILDKEGSIKERISEGLKSGFAFYDNMEFIDEVMTPYGRLRDIDAFAKTDRGEIHGSGYVVDALEAAVWSLLQEESFDKALLTAVNLGEDTDTVAAIAGGLAGLYYGYEAIPKEWLAVIKRREWIEELCDKADAENRFWN